MSRAACIVAWAAWIAMLLVGLRAAWYSVGF
jgi:hypothetical protein